MMSKHNPQYVFDLQDVDVLCGRGSGPNDRAGNIEFRNLILTRKAEYLAAKTRDAKGRIASDIVNIVRARGGRFLKKLSPAQVKEAGFKRGVAVYEFADEPTVLEKAKQTLRQNRAAFAKAHVDQESEDGVDGNGGNYGGTNGNFDGAMNNYANMTSSAHSGHSGGSGNMNLNISLSQACPSSNYHNMSSPGPVSNNYVGGSGGSSSMNPIPLSQASYMLDSDKLPPLGSNEARQLQNALFASSSISSKGMHGGNKNVRIEGLIHAAESLSSSRHQINCNDQQVDLNATRNSSSISSKDLPGYNRRSDQVNLSMDMSLLLNSKNSGPHMSNNSAEGFGSLIKEFSAPDQASLMKQYEALKEQHQQALLQQYEIMKRQHEHMVDSMYPDFSPANSNDMNMIAHQNYPPQRTNNQMPPPKSNQQPMTDAERKFMQSFAEDSLSRHNNERRNSDGFSSDVFRSLMREYTEDLSVMNQYQNTQNSQYQNNPYQNAQDTSRTSNESHFSTVTTSHMSAVSDFSHLSKDPVITGALGTMARQQDFNDQQKLFQQFQMQQQAHQSHAASINQAINLSQPINGNDSTDRDYLIATKDDGIVKPAPQNKAKRPSRRPRDENIEQSLTLGAVFGKNIESKMKEDILNSSGSSMNTPSSNSRKSGQQAPRDSSLLSLMSMSVSLSEISHDLVSKNPGGGSNARPPTTAETMNGSATSAQTVRRHHSNEIDKLKDMSYMSLGDSWALDDC